MGLFNRVEHPHHRNIGLGGAAVIEVYWPTNPNHGQTNEERRQDHGQPVSAKNVRIPNGSHNDYLPVHKFDSVVFVQDARLFHTQVFVHIEEADASQHVGLFALGDDAGGNQGLALFRGERAHWR